MSCLHLVKPQDQQYFSGNFRMGHHVYARTKNNNPYLRLSLENMHGKLPAYLWQRDLFENLSLNRCEKIYVEGQLRNHSGRQVLDVSFIDSLNNHSIENIVQLIPQDICPIPKLLTDLQAAVKRITIKPLANFVSSVLGDDSIGFLYVSAPASIYHHHNFPGGLLLHSLECFKMVERHTEFNEDDWQLGLVATLFHDISKILTMTSNMRHTTLGKSMNHDKLTFEVLAPYLRQLDNDWPDGSAQLRYILNWKLSSKIPKYDIAELVACCDRISAGLDIKKRGIR